MPAPSNTQQRREEIAFALARVMARAGYDGASVTAIAQEAGIVSGGVHYHFDSKAEILTDLIERLVATARARIERRLEDAESPRTRLTAILDALLDVDAGADPHAVAVWALVGAEAVRSDDVRELYGGWLAQARDVLRNEFARACRTEGRQSTGATRAAAALVTLVEGYYAVAAGAPGVVPPGSAAPAARRIALALLDGQPARAA
jgi:TetR/AcrR family transcriptional repressor of bet genes